MPSTSKIPILNREDGDSDIIKCSILADNVATSPGPTPAKYSNGTYRRLTTKNDLIPQNDITVQVIPTKSIANNDAIVATTPFTPIIDKDSIGAPTSSANSIYEDSIVTISSTDITSWLFLLYQIVLLKVIPMILLLHLLFPIYPIFQFSMNLFSKMFLPSRKLYLNS